MRRGIVYAGIFLSLLAAAVGAAVQEINSAPWLRGFHFQEANAEIPLFVERHGSTTLSLRKSLDYGLHRTARDYGAGLPTGSVEWSPDGASLAIAGDNETHLTFVTPSGNVLHSVPVELTASHSLLLLSGTSRFVFSPYRPANRDSTLAMADAGSGRTLLEVPGPQPGKDPSFNRAYHLAVSSDQKLAAVSFFWTNNVLIYRTDDWKVLCRINIDRVPQGLLFFPDNRRVVIAAKPSVFFIVDAIAGTVLNKIKVPNTGDDPKHFPQSTSASAMAVSPDQTELLIGTWVTFLTPSTDDIPMKDEPHGAVQILRIKDGASTASFDWAQPGIYGAAWDSKGHYVAFIDGRDLYLWQPARPSPSYVKVGFPENVGSLSMTSDGSRIAVATERHVIVFQVEAR